MLYMINSKTCNTKIDNTKILLTNGSLMKVESIVEFCNTFDLHLAIIGLENHFFGLFYTDVTVL